MGIMYRLDGMQGSDRMKEALESFPEPVSRKQRSLSPAGRCSQAADRDRTRTVIV
jgi:hypothetical protein